MPTRLTKLARPGRSSIRDVVSSQPHEIVENKEVFLTEGFAPQPTIKGAEHRMADFYRDGNRAEIGEEGDDIHVERHAQRAISDFAGVEGEHASIRVLGPPVPDADDERQDLIPPYSKFILSGVQEAHQERSQVIETFGDFYAFFFGERPPVYNFTGTLINTRDINWLADFMFHYENFLRGTKCAENNATLILTYGGRQIEGFMMNANNATAAATENGVQLSFQILVIDRKFLSLSVDTGLAIQRDAMGVTRTITDEAFLNNLSEAGISRAEVSSAYQTVDQVVRGQTPAADGSRAISSQLDALGGEHGVNLSPTSGGGLELA